MNEILLRDIEDELKSARIKYPEPNHMLSAITEEVGELAKSLLDLQFHDEGSSLDVYNEAIQVIVTAIRIIQEGDTTFPAYKPFPGLRDETQ